MTSISPASAARPRRLLVLSPFAPRLDASMGGPVVIAGLITALSRFERIGLLYLRGCGEPGLDPHVRDVCDFAIEAPRLTGGRWRAASDAARCVLQSTPRWVAEWQAAECGTQLQSLMAGWRPDIVQAEFHVMGQYLPRAARPARSPCSPSMSRARPH